MYVLWARYFVRLHIPPIPLPRMQANVMNFVKETGELPELSLGSDLEDGDDSGHAPMDQALDDRPGDDEAQNGDEEEEENEDDDEGDTGEIFVPLSADEAADYDDNDVASQVEDDDDVDFNG